MDELLNYLRLYIWKDKGSSDLFYVVSSKLKILDGHSGRIPVRASSTIVKILNLTVIVCHLGGPFSVVFPKKKTINCSLVTYFIRFYCIKFVKIGPTNSFAKIKLNPFRVISVSHILCKLGLSHALTCLSSWSHWIRACPRTVCLFNHTTPAVANQRNWQGS